MFALILSLFVHQPSLANPSIMGVTTEICYKMLNKKTPIEDAQKLLIGQLPDAELTDESTVFNIRFALELLAKTVKKTNVLTDGEKVKLWQSLLPKLEKSQVIFYAAVNVINLFNQLNCPTCETDVLDSMVFNVIKNFFGVGFDSLYYLEMPMKHSIEAKNAMEWIRFYISRHRGHDELYEYLKRDVPDRVALLNAAINGSGQNELTQSEWTALIRLALQNNTRLKVILKIFCLDFSALESFKSEMNPLQMLEYNYILKGTLTSVDVDEFDLKIKTAIIFWKENEFNDHIHFFLQLLVDEKVPYELFEQIMTSANKNESNRYYGVPFIKKLVTPQNRSRMIQYFGEGEVEPIKYWAQARAYAAALKSELEQEHFSSAQEFIEHFKIKRIFFISPEPTNNRNIYVHAVAEVYYQVLLARLDAFFKLNPTAAQIRWILETPAQFPVSIERAKAHSISSQGATRPYDLDTWSSVQKVLTQTMERAIPFIKNGDDVTEVFDYGTPDSFEFEQLRDDISGKYYMLYLYGQQLSGKIPWMPIGKIQRFIHSAPGYGYKIEELETQGNQTQIEITKIK